MANNRIYLPSPISEYGLLSDCRRAALVNLQGSIDWLCLPRFDSPACFSALIGTGENGHWQISPSREFTTTRKYRDDSMVLESTFTTSTGSVLLTDFLVVGEDAPLLLRQVKGLSGRVPMRCLVSLRFDYGAVTPWMRKFPGGIRALAGPDEIHIESDASLKINEDLDAVADFEIGEGDEKWFSLKWNPYFRTEYEAVTDREKKLADTDAYWKKYSSQCTYTGKYRDILIRSILTLKSLTYRPTGGIVAAPTTSLPETLGGERNWDYRYCWVRDSTFSMYALLTAGYRDEAKEWREWLVRALAGTPSQVNIMYGLAGERRLHEVELPWLEGYESSKPVRTGNAAYLQRQLDVFGEALDTFWLALKSGLPSTEDSWRIQRCFIEYVKQHWDDPDEGIWEMRGPPQHFVHSKVMAWVAVDRAIHSARYGRLEAPLDEWIRLRDQIHRDVCAKGFDQKLGSFTQTYGSTNLDASLLMIPIVGFLPPEDPRVEGTVRAVERELFKEGFVLRYKTDEVKDVLQGREGSFIACSFWLVDCWVLMGRLTEAEDLFQRLLSLANDLQLLSEEYESRENRLVGNFPQALSHIALINSAFNLFHHRGPAKDRSRTSESG
jgi:GH15 family glucan-1,4-alpha-glucosidase